MCALPALRPHSSKQLTDEQQKVDATTSIFGEQDRKQANLPFGKIPTQSRHEPRILSLDVLNRGSRFAATRIATDMGFPSKSGFHLIRVLHITFLLWFTSCRSVIFIYLDRNKALGQDV